MPDTFATLTATWPAEARALLETLDSPPAIQAFLDATPYSAEERYRSPLTVLQERKAHCFDGAMLAACALRRLGEAPLLVDLRAHNDDDHVLAVFKRHGHYGCIAKSNTTVLRYREPVYRSVRELAMSFFDFYYNLNGDKALREYSALLDLRQYDRIGWMSKDDQLEQIAERLGTIRHFPTVTPAMIDGLIKVHPQLFDAGLMGADAAGLFKPV